MAFLPTDCEKDTLKSLLPWAFAALDVHLRLRKRPPRCTLDCGFKTSESPALRGFVGGPQALATAVLYLVLKSNGYNHPENRFKKFKFSLKTISMNLAKKLSEQSLLKSVFFHIFNFAHKCLTFAFTHESVYTLGSLRKITHRGLHAETHGFTPAAARSVSLTPLTFGQRTAGGSGCTPVACVRFLRRRGPAGLRDLFHFYRNCSLYALCLRFSAHTRWGWYRCPRCALHVLRTLGARLSKRLICRFLRLGDYH